MQLVLYVVGHNAYVHLRDACSISRVNMFIPVEFRNISSGDIGASEMLRVG